MKWYILIFTAGTTHHLTNTPTLVLEIYPKILILTYKHRKACISLLLWFEYNLSVPQRFICNTSIPKEMLLKSQWAFKWYGTEEVPRAIKFMSLKKTVGAYLIWSLCSSSRYDHLLLDTLFSYALTLIEGKPLGKPGLRWEHPKLPAK